MYLHNTEDYMPNDYRRTGTEEQLRARMRESDTNWMLQTYREFGGTNEPLTEKEFDVNTMARVNATPAFYESLAKEGKPCWRRQGFCSRARYIAISRWGSFKWRLSCWWNRFRHDAYYRMRMNQLTR